MVSASTMGLMLSKKTTFRAGRVAISLPRVAGQRPWRSLRFLPQGRRDFPRAGSVRALHNRLCTSPENTSRRRSVRGPRGRGTRLPHGSARTKPAQFLHPEPGSEFLLHTLERVAADQFAAGLSLGGRQPHCPHLVNSRAKSRASHHQARFAHPRAAAQMCILLLTHVTTIVAVFAERTGTGKTPRHFQHSPSPISMRRNFTLSRSEQDDRYQ
jgi:hypothetical protein